MKQFKFTISILFCLALTQSMGQTKWLYYTSVEESFVIGDQNASFNPLVISNAANNSGIRLGAIIGSTRLNGFTTKLVPVEVLGQYEITTFGEVDYLPLQLKGNVGVGIALARAQSNSFNPAGTVGLAENFTLGASLDIIEIDNHILGIGYRHTFFTDDYLDATISEGGLDQLSRWFAYGKIDFTSKSKELKAQIAAKNYQINQLESILKKQSKLDSEDGLTKNVQGEGETQTETDINEVNKSSETGLITSNEDRDNVGVTANVSESTQLEPVIPRAEINSEFSDLNPNRFDEVEIGQNTAQPIKSSSENQGNPKDELTDAQNTVNENATIESSAFPKPFKRRTKTSDNVERKYAIVVGTFDSIEEAENYIRKVPGGKAFTTEVGPLGKFRVIYGLYPSVNEEVLYRLEELRFYGFKPWITKI
jgi:cell division septation protein DedD